MKVFKVLLVFIILNGCSRVIKPKQLFTDVKELSSDRYKGRKTGTAENQMAAEYIVGRFKSIGLKAYADDFRKPFTFKEKSGTEVKATNLIGYIAGKKPDAIVISAHYDHVGESKGEVYNGADDNASGVGGLLAIAEYFSKNKPEHTLIFAAFDAEEAGLQGAKAFVRNLPVDSARLKLNVNMDMISRSKKNELYVVGTFHYPLLKSHVVTTHPKIKLLFGHDDPKLGKDDWTNQSDQAAFHAKRIPFLYFGVEDHPDYHQPTDDYEKIDKAFYNNAVSSILEVVKNLDQSVTIEKVHKDKHIMK